MCLSINLFAQTLNGVDILKSKGQFNEFVSVDGQSFKVGDTLTIGVPFRNNEFLYMFQNAGIAMYPVYMNASGSKVIIKKIHVMMKVLYVNVTHPQGYVYGLMINKFDEALKYGEIKTNMMSSSEAINKLKDEKEKLNLGIITQEEYDAKKSILIKFIK